MGVSKEQKVVHFLRGLANVLEFIRCIFCKYFFIVCQYDFSNVLIVFFFSWTNVLIVLELLEGSFYMYNVMNNS